MRTTPVEVNLEICAAYFRNEPPRSVGSFGQARKSARGMPWHWEPMKGVAIYEKPRLAESRRLTRGCPNGETRPDKPGHHTLNS